MNGNPQHDKDNEEKMIEAIIYSLTEIKEIKKIKILVENNPLTKLPNSQKKLPDCLDKNYGINKIYNLDSIKESTKTTIYYLSKFQDYHYFVPVTKINNEKTEKVEIISSWSEDNKQINVYKEYSSCEDNFEYLKIWGLICVLFMIIIDCCLFHWVWSINQFYSTTNN